jgi:hypothetical protein
VQIVQTLRTGGDLNFEEVSLVIPFIELAYDYGIEDLDAPQPGCIRGYKTHKHPSFCSAVEGTKVIYVARNPLDVRFCLRQIQRSSVLLINTFFEYSAQQIPGAIDGGCELNAGQTIGLWFASRLKV